MLPSLSIPDLADPGIAGQWDSYVRSHPHGSVFHLTAWQRLIERSFRHKPQHLVALDREGKVLGLLPLFLVRSRIFGRMLVSTPQAAYGGILAESDTVAKAILELARRMAAANKVRFLELRNFKNALEVPGLMPKDLYVTFRQELSPEVELNMRAIPRKTRAEIREGIRNGLEFKVNEIGVNQFYDVYSRSLRNLGTPVFSKSLFANGVREFSSNCRIFSVHWHGKLVSAVWTLFYKDEVLPYYGGSMREYNRLAVNNFMYWMLIKYGCENGYRIYDFGRSKKGTGSFDFKKRWGMTMSELPYQYALVRQNSPPDTSPLNPRFSMGIRIWRRLPLWMTNSIGPLIARHLI
ncbi:MAG: FemAB family PEP-CTERM system-associated protein [Acidobacteriia bacterium]|nr:FemAB family PEP-CTERM system-associated protein [Terriglobia bacterium]